MGLDKLLKIMMIPLPRGILSRNIAKKIVFLFACAFFSPFAIPALTAGKEQPCNSALAGKIQADYQAISSFSGDFTQLDQQKEGGEEKAKGEIDYLKPGKMRWNYEPPHQQLLVTDGKKVWLYDPLLDNVTVQPLKGLTQGTPLAFLLGVGNLTEDFFCTPFTQSPPHDGLTYLELHPKKPIPGLVYIQLGVQPDSSRISAIRMVDNLGNIRLLRLKNLKIGVKFPQGHFSFLVTEGMEVISNDQSGS